MISSSELEDLRRRNRSALGLAGYLADACCSSCASGGACDGKKNEVGPWGQMVNAVPGMGASALSFMPPVGIEFSFPRFAAQWAPGETQPSSSQGSVVGDWLAAHVLRPKVSVGGVMVDPWQSYSDWSGVAEALAIAAAGIATIGGMYVLGRAFYPTRWMR